MVNELKTVITIDASQPKTSVKDLRKEIKGLKDELLNLDQGTQEYTNTLVELGEKTHTLKELQEQVNSTNTDTGTLFKHTSSIMQGSIGAVQAMTSGLSMLGVEMGDDDKLVKKLVKSMSLIQALGTLDPMVKSFKSLTAVIKTSAMAAGGLGKALKSLAVSNPFGLILTAAPILIGVFSFLKKDTEDMISENEKLKKSVDEIIASYYDITNALSGIRITTRLEGDDEVNKQVDAMISTFENFKRSHASLTNEEAWNEFAKAMGPAQDGLIKLANAEYNLRDATLQREEAQRKASMGYTDQWYTEADGKETYKAFHDRVVQEAQDAQAVEEKLMATRNANATAFYAERDRIEQDANNKRKQAVEKANQDRLKAEEDIYKLQKQLIENSLKERLLDISKSYEEEEEKANQNYEAQKKYYEELIALENKRLEGVDPKKEANKYAEINGTLISLQTSLHNTTKEYEELNNTRVATALDQQAFNDELNITEQRLDLLKEYNQRKLDILKQGNEDTTALELEYESQRLYVDQERIQGELENLQARYDQRLIMEDEYLKRKLELETEQVENEGRLKEIEVEQERQAQERKKQLLESYYDAYKSMAGHITALLSAAADQEDISFEAQKKIRKAETIISTFTAAIEAYKSMAGIPMVGPALGAAAAAAVTATGLLNVRKIEQTKPGSSSTPSASAPAMATISSPSTPTTLTGFSPEITLPDQRVYVVESDITDAQRRVQVTQQNNTF